MEQIINGILIIATIAYMIAIVFYVENIGFFQKGKFDWKLELKLIGFVIGLFFLNQFFHVPRIFILLIILLSLAVWMMKKGQLLHDLLSILIFCFAILSVAGIPNFVFQTLSMSKTSVNHSSRFLQWAGGSEQSLFISILAFTTSLVVLAMHGILKNKIDKRFFESINLKMTLLTCGIALLLLQVRLRNDLRIFDWSLNLDIIEPLLFLFLFLFLGIMTYMNIIHTDRQFKIEKERAENAAFEKYTAELETSYDALRVIKHDYMNIMTSLKLFIDEKNIDGLQEYYYQEFSELSKSLNADDRIIDQLQRVKIKELKSILLYKLNMATEMGLAVHIEVKFVVGNLPISKMRMCQIIGILLDNAIEASQESSEKVLNLAIISGETKTTVMIENSWVAAAIPMKKFFEKGFSTKGESRGLGLATVDELVEKYEELELTTEVDGERFLQILTVKEIV